jgi:Domain of unknown function (DUF4114)
MAEIKLGQSITGSFASGDLRRTDPTSPLNGGYSDEYDLSDLDDFRQLNLTLQRPAATTGSTLLSLIDTATGAIIAENIQAGAGTLSLPETTFPGIKYKIRVTSSQFGDYQLSIGDGGKATSIVSPYTPNSIDQKTSSIVGTIGQTGKYFSLASAGSAFALADIALAPNGQFYGVGADTTPSNLDRLYRIDPSLDRSQQVQLVGVIKDANGNSLSSKIASLEFAADNQLYGIGYAGEAARFYQIDVQTNIATNLGTLPQSFLIGGDLVYDAANQRFLATSLDATNTSSDALWQIPRANPAQATKIGLTGFTDVYGLSLEGGKLSGFTAQIVPDGTGATQISINPSTGKGTFDRSITGTQTFGIGGAATILTANASTGIVLDVVKLDSAAQANQIGTKSQGLQQGKTIDLTDYAGQKLKVDLTTTSDASYTNNIGFYVVEDSIGTIKLTNGTTLQPSDVNYAVEAIKNAVFQAGKTDRQLGQDLVGGKIYAPVVVAQGSLNDFVTKNPTNGGGANDLHAYFNYVGANPDKLDHFRLLGNNTFGVEDMYGGGDKDFNDLVVNLNIKTV